MKSFSKSLRLMGNNFTITVVTEDEIAADGHINIAVTEIQRIEKLFTTFDPASQTNLINAQAGLKPAIVDKEVFELIRRSIAISNLTQGAFDITYGGIVMGLWNFDTNMTALPSREIAKKMVYLINYRNIILNNEESSVMLLNKGMRIGFGGIGKGYAAEMAKKKLVERNVLSGIINASGDLTTWGTQASGKPWTIGIAHPDNPNSAFSYLNISGKAIATSGNYEKFITINGKKFSHTIDPKTGFPVTGIKSVTVISNNAELADAMATPIAVMGIKPGLFMIDQIPDLHCLIIDDNNQIYTSQNINLK